MTREDLEKLDTAQLITLLLELIAENWTVSCKNWDMVLNQLSILFADRISA